MIAVTSAAIVGIEAVAIQVEIDIRPGLPAFEIVGLAGQAVKESRERIRSALKNSGFSYPLQRIVVNLAPANIRKNGTLYDLPIALGIIAGMGRMPVEQLQRYIIVGELSLNGELRSVSGMISIAELAEQQGKKLLVPAENGPEAAAVTGQAYTVQNLSQACSVLSNNTNFLPFKQPDFEPTAAPPRFNTLIKGQITAKRMLTIAAAGHHHALLIGPPGTGKTLLAQSVHALLPPMSRQESLETTKVLSCAGLLPPRSGLITSRPVRMPHHNISKAGLLGGGSPIKPGEVSLANNGVLILDELLEFDNDVLQGLREPLENRQITVVRANERVTYPTKFLLIATTNACPCGYLGDSNRQCRCTWLEIRRYQKKLFGPLLDRIDLFTFLEPVTAEDLRLQQGSIPVPARNCHRNGLLSDEQTQAIRLSPEVQALLEKALHSLKLSGRGYYKTIRIAKTIAELDGAPRIEPRHAAEALRYRWEAVNIFS